MAAREAIEYDTVIVASRNETRQWTVDWNWMKENGPLVNHSLLKASWSSRTALIHHNKPFDRVISLHLLYFGSFVRKKTSL